MHICENISLCKSWAREFTLEFPLKNINYHDTGVIKL